MNKENVSSYLWIIVTVIIMLCLLAFASPFGVYVKNNLEQFTGEFIEAESEQGTPNAEYCNLTIIYDTADSGKILEKAEVELKKYEQYGIPSPQIDGYVPDIKTVQGTITEDTTIKVKYSRGNYSITYVTNNGSWDVELLNAENKLISDHTTYKFGDTKQLLGEDDIQRDSMTFMGWYEDEACKGPRVTQIKSTDFGNKIYYAKWSSDEYKITYVMNDAITTVHDTPYTGPYYCKNEYNAGSIAGWDSVVTDVNGNLKSEYTTYSYGSQFKLPVTVHKFGYTFLGWSEEPQGENAKGNYRTQITEADTGDITLYAHWKRNTYTITYHTDFIRPTGEKAYYKIKDTQYTITDSYGNKTTHTGYPLTYTYGDTIKLPTNLELHGYDSTDMKEIVWYNQQTEKIEIKPGGENEGTVSGYPTDLIYKGIISPTTVGFVIGSTSDHAYDHTNLDLYVRPVPDKYVVEFVPNVNSVYTKPTPEKSVFQNFLYDETKPLTANQFEANGRTFLNWNTKADGTGETLEDQQIATNLIDMYDYDHDGKVVLYAQWKVHKYNVKYDLNWKDNESTPPQKAPNGSYPEEAIYDIPFCVTNPVRKGYTFMGWKAISGLNPDTALYGTEDSIKSLNSAKKMTSETICSTEDGQVYFVNLTPEDNGTVTLQAQWSNNGHLPGMTGIQYNLNQPEDSSSTPHLGKNSPVNFVFDQDVEISHPTMLGYKFTGWTISGIDIDKDENGQRTYLNYYGNDAYTVINKTIFPDQTLITTPTLENITATHFINLRESGIVTFTANWTPIEYNISYDLNHKGNESTKPQMADGQTNPKNDVVSYDQSFTVLNPTRVGYIFAGWSLSGMSSSNHYYGDAPYTIVDHKISPNSTKFTNTTGVTVSPSKTHFINLHCVDGATVKFTANWTPIRYNIVYNTQGVVLFNNENKLIAKGESVNIGKLTSTARFDKSFSVPTPSTRHYTFKGWKITGLSNNTTHYYGNTVYTVSNKSVTPSTTAVTGTSLSRINGTYFINLQSEKGQTVRFIALWEPNTYTIKLDKQGGTDGDDLFREKYGIDFYSSKNMPITTIIPPDRDHYIFEGYYTEKGGKGTQCVDKNGKIIVGPTFFEDDTTIYAKWTPEIYEITLDKQGGARGDSTIYEKYNTAFYMDPSCTGALITSIDDPFKAHYIFGGYYTEEAGKGTQCIDANGKILVSSTFFEKDTTIYAKWTPRVYTITLDKNGGTKNTNYFYEKYGIDYYMDPSCAISTKSITPPRKTGYTFQGYFITDLDDCSYGNCEHSSNNDMVVDKSGKILTDNVYYTSDTTIHAHWTRNPYTVTLDKQGGTGGVDKFSTIYGINAFKYDSFETPINGISVPTKKGYVFDGYYTQPYGGGYKYVDAPQSNSSTGLLTKDANGQKKVIYITKNTTLYASWLPTSYKITYVLNGGTHGTSHPTTAFYNESFTVSNPTRTNYKFVGWDITGVCNCCHNPESSEFTKQKGTSYKNLRCSSGTVTFTAKWNPPHTCDFNKTVSAAGCESGGKKYKTYSCPSTCPNYQKVVIIANANKTPLGHKSTGEGTCTSHHHVDSTHGSWYYFDGNHERTHSSWWRWSCSDAHNIRDGLEDVSGYTTAYCARMTKFKDSDYSRQGKNGNYYSGKRLHDFCYLDGGFYQIPKYRFECAGKRNAASGKVLNNFVSKYNELRKKSSHAVYQYMITNHSECKKGASNLPSAGWQNCCTSSKCYNRHRANGIGQVKCGSCGEMNKASAKKCSDCGKTL